MITRDEIPDESFDAAMEVAVKDGLRASIAAAINAWPGMHIHEWQRPWLGGMSGTDIILPLTEPRDD